MHTENKQPSILRLWWRSRQLISTVWTATTALYILFFGSIYILLSSNLVGIEIPQTGFNRFFIGLAFFHASLTAQFYSLVFNRRTYPMLPKAKSRGLMMVLLEFLFSWTTLAITSVLFALILKNLELVNGTFLLILIATWGISFSLWLLFTKIPSAFHLLLIVPAYMLGYNYVFFSMLLCTSILWVEITLYFRNKNAERSNFELNNWKRFGQMGFLVEGVNYFRLGAKAFHIRDFPSISIIRYLSVSIVMETAILFSILIIMLGVSELIDFTSSGEISFENRNIQFGFIFCFIYRYLAKVFGVNTLENGVSGLMGLSRESWFKTRQKTKILDRLSILLGWILTLTIFLMVASLLNTESINPQKLILDTVIPILFLTPPLALFMLIRHINQHQKLFSQTTKNYLRGATVENISWMILLGIAYVFLLVAVLALFNNSQWYSIENLSNPIIASTIALLYSLLVSGAFYFENKFEKITFEQGDLV